MKAEQPISSPQPLVSLLVPVYKVEPYIARCAESLLSQDYEPLDIVFVDDCSPDGSVAVVQEVIDRFPERNGQVRILRHRRNRGLAASRNSAVEAARGEFVMHVDGDDFIEPHTVRLAIAEALKTRADVVVFDIRHLYADKGFVQTSPLPALMPNGLRLAEAMLCHQTPPSVVAKLWRRSLYVDNGISAVEGVNFCEDYSVSPRLAAVSCRVAHLSLPLYVYTHVNPSSYTEDFRPSNLDQQQQAVEILREFFAALRASGSSQADAFWTAFERGCLFSKMRMVREVGLHPKTLSPYLPKINGLYPQETQRHWASLPLPHRLMMLLASRGLPGLLSLYVQGGCRLKHFLKR